MLAPKSWSINKFCEVFTVTKHKELQSKDCLEFQKQGLLVFKLKYSDKNWIFEIFFPKTKMVCYCRAIKYPQCMCLLKIHQKC